MNKVNKLTKLLIKAIKRTEAVDDPQLLKILEEAYEIHCNIENQLDKIRTAIDVVKRFQ